MGDTSSVVEPCLRSAELVALDGNARHSSKLRLPAGSLYPGHCDTHSLGCRSEIAERTETVVSDLSNTMTFTKLRKKEEIRRAGKNSSVTPFLAEQFI